MSVGRLTSVAALCLAVLLGVVGTWLKVSDDEETPEVPQVGVPIANENRRTVVTPDEPKQAPPAAARRGDSREGDRGVPDQIAGPVLRESTPVALRIPRLRVGTTLVPLRIDGEGAMEVPQDPALAGWYALGPTPGALGPAVIAGHVNWNGAPGVFSRLAQLRAGDTVSVSREDGRTAVFAVSRVAQFSKQHFPTEAVFGVVDRAALRLITCAGDYDAAARHYTDNAVVFARLVGVHRTPA